MRASRPRRILPAALVLAALVTAVTVGGCKCLRAPVNASPGLRWWLFSIFGAQKICPEMLKSGMGLKMQERGPVVGRFFPSGCRVETSGENQTVTVHFDGSGYAFTPVTRRVTFRARGSVEYRPDFYLGEEDIYVWGKVNRILDGPTFELGAVENPIADAALTPLNHVANLFGNQIMAGELTRGFTVLQNWESDSKTFGLGIIQPPNKPHTPYDVSGSDIHTFSNETIEVQVNQRDFLGPFEVVDDDQQIQMRMFLQGPAVEALVVSRATGDAWRASYERGDPLTPPPGPIVAGSALQPGQEVRAAYRVPQGQYYVVIDHTQYAGQVNPPPTNILDPFGGPVARISYVAQLGEY